MKIKQLLDNYEWQTFVADKSNFVYGGSHSLWWPETTIMKSHNEVICGQLLLCFFAVKGKKYIGLKESVYNDGYKMAFHSILKYLYYLLLDDL